MVVARPRVPARGGSESPLFYVHVREVEMKWEKPEFTELQLCMEITTYVQSR